MLVLTPAFLKIRLIKKEETAYDINAQTKAIIIIIKINAPLAAARPPNNVVASVVLKFDEVNTVLVSYILSPIC